jgi:hypothetical protein
MAEAQTTPEQSIRCLWLRDAVEAFKQLARPVATVMCGYAVMMAALRNPVEMVVAIAAGIVVGVSYFRSQDKRAGVGQGDTA